MAAAAQHGRGWVAAPHGGSLAHEDAPYAGARVFLSLGGEKNKWDFLAARARCMTLGMQIMATRLTSAFLTANNVPNTRIYKIHEVSSGRAGRRR